MQIRIICLLPHPPHPWAFSCIKLQNCFILVRKQLLTILRSKNSEEIGHFEEIIHPKQRPKHAFSFANNFKPPGISCIFCCWAWVLVFRLLVSSFTHPIRYLVIKLQRKNYGKTVLNEEIAVHKWQQKVNHVMMELNSQ